MSTRSNGESSEIESLVGFGEAACRHLSEHLLRCLGAVEAAPKKRFDVVTAADLEGEQWFREQVRREFPSHGVVGEEFANERVGQQSEFVWILDPLDGTVNFANGTPLFCASIALWHQGSPLLAWVVDPLRRELFHARRGAGATLNGEPLRHAPAGNAMLPLAVSTGYVKKLIEREQAGGLVRLLETFGKFRNLGSQALHLCYLAAGRFAAVICDDSKLWDDAAGWLIVTESGSHYSRPSGEAMGPLDADDPAWRGEPFESVAARPEAFRKLLECLGASRAE